MHVPPLRQGFGKQSLAAGVGEGLEEGGDTAFSHRGPVNAAGQSQRKVPTPKNEGRKTKATQHNRT